MSILAQKKCTVCKKEKPTTEFRKDTRTKTSISSCCLECNKNKSKAWRDKNPEKSRASVKRYRINHPGKHKEMYDDWAARNPERLRELSRLSYKRNIDSKRESSKRSHEKRKRDHPDDVRDYQSKWAKENPEKVKEAQRKWVRAHPERVAVKAQKRNALKRNNGGSVTEDEWIRVLQKYNYTCLWCKRSDVKVTMDHVIPLSRGGLHEVENIQPLCQSCNSRKGAKVMDFR